MIQVGVNQNYQAEVGIKFNDTKFGVFYRNTSIGDKLFGNVVTLDGTTLYLGSATECSEKTALYIEALYINETRALICFYNATNDAVGVVAVSLSNDELVPEETINASTNQGYYVAADTLNPAKVVVCYQHVDNASRLYAKVLVDN